MICELPNVGYYGKGGNILRNDVDILNSIQGERMLCELLSDEIITDRKYEKCDMGRGLAYI